MLNIHFYMVPGPVHYKTQVLFLKGLWVLLKTIAVNVEQIPTINWKRPFHNKGPVLTARSLQQVTGSIPGRAFCKDYVHLVCACFLGFFSVFLPNFRKMNHRCEWCMSVYVALWTGYGLENCPGFTLPSLIASSDWLKSEKNSDKSQLACENHTKNELKSKKELISTSKSV